MNKELRNAVAIKPSVEVNASIAIRAEYRRVVSALTTPEYMEAWLDMPGVGRFECYPDQHSAHRFKIDIHNAKLESRVIHGSCIFSKPSTVTYLWEESLGLEKSQSIVNMDLRSGPQRCSLKLKHNGLPCETESNWYAVMWRKSLNNLCRLLEAVPAQRSPQHDRPAY